MKRVTGIGGIFFKAKDPVALAAWYKKHLGIDVQAWAVPRSRGPMTRAMPSRARRSGRSAPRTVITMHRASRRS